MTLNEAKPVASAADRAAVAAAISKAAPVEKSARVLLDSAPTAYEVFRIVRLDGRRFDLAVLQSDAKKESALLKVLQDSGAELPENVVEAKQVVARLVEMPPARKGGQIVTRWGWHEPGKVFVRNNRWITGAPRDQGRAGQRRYLSNKKTYYACAHFDQTKASNLLGPSAISAETDGMFKRAGTLKGWKKGTAKLARYSSALRFCIATALAAPLLELLKAEPFIVLLTGPSSHGKTTAECAAGSVTGKPSLEDLPTWNLTDPRLEQIGRIHNDSLLIIDDLKTAGGSDKERFYALQHRVHWFTGGGKRGRQSNAVASQTGRSDAHLGFRSLILSSYEQPLADIARRANTIFDPGDLVRIVEISVAGPGSTLIFDRLPHEASNNSRKFAEQLLAELRSEAMKHHGVVMDRWIKKLVGAGESLVPSLTEYMSEFLREVEPRLMDSQENRHAKHFAFVYAAGAYAIEQKLLPWKNNAFRKAVLRCHAQSLNNLRNGRSGLPLARATLRKRLEDNDQVKPWPNGGRPARSNETDGWVKHSKTERTYYLIGERFRNWFSSSGELRLVLSQLSRAGLLRTAGTGKTKDVRTANSKKVKCYQIVVPKAFEWDTMGA